MVERNKSTDQKVSHCSGPSHELLASYFNDLLFRLEELLLHEMSWTAAKKVDFVGIDLIRSVDISGDTIKSVIEACVRELTSLGIVEEMEYSLHGFGILLKLNIGGCVHISKEARLKGHGIRPYICPVANIIGDQILKKLGYLAFNVADIAIDTDGRTCVVKCAVYKNVDKIGRISDWKRI